MSLSYDYDRGSRIALVVAGAVIGALVVGLAWVLVLWSGSGATDLERTGATARAAGPAQPRPSTGSSRVERCAEVYDAQRGALEAAASSLSQWEVHIGAMNKLVTGAITLRQAQQFWDQTRVGAMQRLRAFDAAERRFDRRSARCPEPAGRATPSPDLRACAATVAARNRTLHLAVAALGTWELHVHHMEMLRDGEMSPAEATRLWLRSWRQGNQQVQAYRAAARDSDGRTC